MCPDRWDDTMTVGPWLDPRPVHIAEPGMAPVRLNHFRLDGVEFSVSCGLRLTTERSIWLLRPERYLRMPQVEGPREQIRSVEGRMDDCRWHRYRRAWFALKGIWLHANILPTVGPVGGKGIYTGRILAVGGTWDEVEPEQADSTGETGDAND